MYTNRRKKGVRINDKLKIPEGQEYARYFGLLGESVPQVRVSVRALALLGFFVLGPILVKFHIRTRLIQSFPSTFRLWWCAEEKLHFTPFHTLRQLMRDEARFHHLGGSYSFERGTVRYLVAGLGVGKV